MDHKVQLIKQALGSALHAMMERPLSQPVFPIPKVHTLEKQQIVDDWFNRLPPASQMPGLRRRLAVLRANR